MNKNSNLFIDTYNKIDKLLRNELNAEYHESFSYLLKKSKNRIIKQYKKELESFGDLRNAIVHEPRIGGELIADPHPKAVEKLSNIYFKIIKPKTVYELFKKTVEGVKIEDTLKDLLVKIDESSFSQFPVYDNNNKIMEIINTNTIARWLSANLDDNGSLLLIETKVKDLIPSIEDKNNYKFIKRDATAYHAYDMFIDSINSNKRNLDAVFITHNGLDSEAILGLITIEDLSNEINTSIKNGTLI